MKYWAKKIPLNEEHIIDHMREKLANEWAQWKNTIHGKKWMKDSNFV